MSQPQVRREARGPQRAVIHPPPTPTSSYARRPEVWREATPEQWGSWVWQQQHRLRDAAQLAEVVRLSPGEREAIAATAGQFRVGVTPHYAALMDPDDPGCPIRRQAIPQPGEQVVFAFELADPLAEEAHMVAPGVTHRYPDRVLFYVSHHCPVYCRHCTRKRKVSTPESAPRRDAIEAGLDYIARTETVRDVLVSGGDPLTLSNERLDELLGRLRAIEHIDVVRLGTRNPVTLPQRVDEGLARVLARHGPIYVNTHFNHPAEATVEAIAALRRLREAGCVLGNQMVLLAGVNDDAVVVERLNRWLLRHGCRPYYIFQADMAEGITHFRTPLTRGLEIIGALRGRLSGLGVPHFVIDLPGGGGKVALVPEQLESVDGDRLVFRNWQGERFVFVDVDGARRVAAALSEPKA